MAGQEPLANVICLEDDADIDNEGDKLITGTPEVSFGGYVSEKTEVEIMDDVVFSYENLHKYAREGRANELREFLNKYRSKLPRFIDRLDSEKLAALHYAVRFNYLRCVRLLVEEGGADVNVLSDDKGTPLHYAVRYRRRRQTSKVAQLGRLWGGKALSGENPSRGRGSLLEKRKLSETSRKSLDGDEEKPSRSASGRGMLASSSSFPESLEETTEGLKIPFQPGLAKVVSSRHFKRLLEEESQPTGDNSVILFLVSRGARVNQTDFYGCTPLHYAALRGNEVATQHLLLVKGIEIDRPDNEGMSPLHLACSHGHSEIIHMLLERDAALMQREESGCLPIHNACSNGSLPAVRLLLDAAEKRRGIQGVYDMLHTEANDRITPLHAAAACGHIEVAHVCILKGANVNAVTSSGETPLHLASRFGSIDLVRLLLKHHARIDAGDRWQQTSLHKATERNHVNLMLYLIKEKADMERRDASSSTPLLLAANVGQCEAIRLLTQLGANCLVTDKNNWTSLYLAASNNHLEAVKILIDKAPDALTLLETPDIKNNTPLHAACKMGHFEVAKVLLANKASVGVKNEDEKTPMHLAAENGRTKNSVLCAGSIVRMLAVECHQLVFDEDEDSNTPLHLASTSGYPRVIDVLLDAGANINARNNKKWAPLDCSAANGQFRAAEVLLRRGAVVDPQDKAKVTPLYLACKKGHLDTVNLLLKWNADPSLRVATEEQDPSAGSNALDAAIDNGHKACALAIVRSSQWKSALRNRTQAFGGRMETPMRKLIKKMPDVAEEVFRRCTTSNGLHREHPDYKMTFNFEFLDDTYSNWSGSLKAGTAPVTVDDMKNDMAELYFIGASAGSLSANGTGLGPEQRIYDDKQRLLPHVQPYTRDSKVIKHNHPLMIMVSNMQANLLAHPLVLTLVQHKWSSFGRTIYYLNLLVYTVFLAFLSLYIVQTKPPFYFEQENATAIGESESCPGGFLYIRPTGTVLAKFAVLVLSGVAILKEIGEFVVLRFNYLGFENITEWAIYILSTLTVIDFDACQVESGLRQDWQWQTGAVAIFLAWINLILFLRRMPRFGIFVVMFTDVLTTFTRFFIVFFLFIIAFAFGFYALLSNQVAFRNLPNSLLKTGIMMLGEFEFSSLFDDRINNSDFSKQVQYVGVTYTIFVIFVVVMSIIIMNLLVGLAVDDIKGVQEMAAVKRLAMQVELTLDLEALLPHMFRQRFVRRQLTIWPNRRRGPLERALNICMSTVTTGEFSIDEKEELEVSEWERLFQLEETAAAELDQTQQRLKLIRCQMKTAVGMLRAVTNKLAVDFVEEDEAEEDRAEMVRVLLRQ